MSIPLEITWSSHPHVEADRVVQALRDGDETVLLTGYGRGVDAVLHQIDALVKAALPAARNVHFHWPRVERLWAWSFSEPKVISYFPRGVVPGHAYFPKGIIGGIAEWVPDSQTRAVDGGKPDGGV